MSNLIEIRIPDIGDFKGVDVIEVAARPGDSLNKDDTLLTLETDKATMDVPTPVSGILREIKVQIGQKVSEGDVVALVEVQEATQPAAAPIAPAPAPAPTTLTSPAMPITPPVATTLVQPPQAAPSVAPTATADSSSARTAHASPSVRRFARELGVDIGQVKGTGPKNRIQQSDVQGFVKAALSGQNTGPARTGNGLDLLPWPSVDFSKFGAIESVPLSRVQKLSGANLARNWAMIPHVTQFDEADITELELFRQSINQEWQKEDIKLTPLAFLIKAVVAALKAFPNLNASLDGDNLVLKQYFHIGFAADTPNGLVVPVIRDADQKGLKQLAEETAQLAGKARDGKLSAADMQGGCFSISSLGGVGGTAFTPIINAPEVAILGVSKTQIKPQWNGEAFVPRHMLPLSLSYDHRVIDGAAAARFTTFLARALADVRRLML